MIKDESLDGFGKATQPGLQSSISLPNGIFYGGYPSIEYNDCITVIITSEGIICAYFQSEADGSSLGEAIDEYLGE